MKDSQPCLTLRRAIGCHFRSWSQLDLVAEVVIHDRLWAPWDECVRGKNLRLMIGFRGNAAPLFWGPIRQTWYEPMMISETEVCTYSVACTFPSHPGTQGMRHRHVVTCRSVHRSTGRAGPHLRTLSPQLSMPLGLLLHACLALVLAASATAHPDNLSLQWGAFRPNLYFGVRPRIRETVLMGLMWARVEDDGHIVAQSKSSAPRGSPR